MDHSDEKTWNWRGEPPVPLPNQISATSLEELVRSHHSMEDRLQRMVLLLEAMRELLQESGVLSESVLRKKFDEIDLRDGSLDGRSDKPFLQICSSCGATSTGLRRFFQTCGSESLSPA